LLVTGTQHIARAERASKAPPTAGQIAIGPRVN
jgi:hypothetical protein